MHTNGIPPGRPDLGDAEHIGREILRDMAGLRRQLARVSGNPDLADDLLQDAVVTALQKVRDGEIQGREQLDGYVYRIALNHLRNHRRKDKSRVSDRDDALESLQSGAKGATEYIESAQWARVIKDMLREITPLRDRELLARFYLREESKELLCQQFGLSDLHFNRVIFRARERFREILTRRGWRKSDFLGFAFILFAAH